tara:strand:+ start:73 stop:534 length:462 start_codon:yes stop_codon:yes gene_type:complete
MILKRGSIVQYPPVIGEHHLPLFQAEFNLKLLLVDQFLHGVQRGQLLQGQRPVNQFVTNLYVIVQISEPKFLTIPMEDRSFGYWTFTLQELASPIQTECTVQILQDIPVVRKDLVMKRYAAYELAFTTGFRGLQTKQPNYVRHVRVEGPVSVE